MTSNQESCRDNTESKPSTKELTGYIFYPFICATVPILLIFHNNFSYVPSRQLILPITTTLVLQACFITFFYALTKCIHKAALLSAIASILFFNFGALIGAMYAAKVEIFGIFVGRTRYALPFLFILFMLLSFFLRRAKISFNTLTKVLNLCFTVFLAILCGQIIYKLSTLQPPGFFDEKLSPGNAAKSNLPDIYYIIPDAYPSSHTLQTVYSYDNSEFLQYLEEKGFFIADKSFSNYTNTFNSLSSTLSFSYLDFLLNIYGKQTNESDIYMFSELIKNSRVRGFLEKLGYKTVAFYTSWHKTELINADHYIARGTALGSLTPFIASEFYRVVIQRTPLYPVTLFLGNRLIWYTKADLEFVANRIVELEYDHPLFVFCHIPAPHGPFLFADELDISSLEERKQPEPPDITGPFPNEYADNPAYRHVKAQLPHEVSRLNAHLKKIVDGLLSRGRKEPVIIIQSDHGSSPAVHDRMFDKDNPSSKHVTELMTILNAIYIPGQSYDHLYKEMSPVNNFRAIFNTIFKMDLQILPDKAYWVLPPYRLKWTEVTHLIKTDENE